MDNLKTTNYDESIENFSFGSNVVNDELYTKVIYFIANNKPAEIIELSKKPEEELSEEEQRRLRKYEEIDTLKELLDCYYNGTADYDDYDTLRIFARNTTPFALMEFAMTDEQLEKANDRIMNFLCYSDNELYSYCDLELLLEQKDDNYLEYLYAKTKIDYILEKSVSKVTNNLSGKKISKTN